MADNPIITYRTLQELTDEFISRFGTPKACQILRETLNGQPTPLNADYIISNLICNGAIQVFSITSRLLKNGTNEDSCYARASCFTLMKKHTHFGYKDIARLFNEEITARIVRYERQKVLDLYDNDKVNVKMAPLVKEHRELTEQSITKIK